MSGIVWASVGFTSPAGSNVSACAAVDVSGVAGLLSTDSEGLLSVGVDCLLSLDCLSTFAPEEAPPPCAGDVVFVPSSDGGVILTVYCQP